MKRSKWLWFTICCGLRCGAQSDPGTDSSTQFWQTCRTQDDCDGLSCLCGRCSQECDRSTDCDRVSRNAVCGVPDENCERSTRVCIPAERRATDGEQDSGAVEETETSASGDSSVRMGPVVATVTIVPAPSLLTAPDRADSDPQAYEMEPLLYTCEPVQTSEFTRSDCPVDLPSGSCDGEAQECRYLMIDTCAVLHECTYGYWTMIQEECIGEASGSTLISGTTSCEDHAPIPDSPCQEDGQVCGHEPCVLGGAPSRIYTCTCGRWTVATKECPRD